MSAITITAKTDLATLPTATRKAITGAYAALAALEPSAARIRRAAKAVGNLRTLGLSVRGIVAVMSVEGNGTLPTGKGSIERLGYVADAIGGEWPDTGDSADAILMSLYRIAQTGRAADVARAAELGRASADGDSAYAAVDAIRRELNAAEHKSLTTAPARPVAGEAADGGKQTDDADADTDADDTTPDEHAAPKRETAATLASASVLALISELSKRAASVSFTPDAVLTEAFDALAAQWEMATDPAATLADA